MTNVTNNVVSRQLVSSRQVCAGPGGREATTVMAAADCD